MKRLLLALVLVFAAGTAYAKKHKCDEGMEPMNKKACYAVDSVEPTNFGPTQVIGRAVFRKDYKLVQLAATLYKGKKVLTKCVAHIRDVEGAEEIAFQAVCGKKSPPHDRVKVRIDAVH